MSRGRLYQIGSHLAGKNFQVIIIAQQVIDNRNCLAPAVDIDPVKTWLEHGSLWWLDATGPQIDGGWISAVFVSGVQIVSTQKKSSHHISRYERTSCHLDRRQCTGQNCHMKLYLNVSTQKEVHNTLAGMNGMDTQRTSQNCQANLYLNYFRPYPHWTINFICFPTPWEVIWSVYLNQPTTKFRSLPETRRWSICTA